MNVEGNMKAGWMYMFKVNSEKKTIITVCLLHKRREEVQFV